VPLDQPIDGSTANNGLVGFAGGMCVTPSGNYVFLSDWYLQYSPATAIFTVPADPDGSDSYGCPAWDVDCSDDTVGFKTAATRTSSTDKTVGYIILSDTTTTSSSTTTTTTDGSTTTTTGRGPCSSEFIYGEHSEETKLLRSFRDNVLSRTQEGQTIIRLYYLWSPIIVKVMEEDEEFRQKVKGMIGGVLPLIEETVE